MTNDIKKNIQKLLESDITNYRIYKDTGIAQSTLSDLKNGKTSIDSMRLDNALKLNEYYLKKFAKSVDILRSSWYSIIRRSER